jgi:alpha-soluble NSF attachment protein
MVATKQALERYLELDPTFASTREYNLLQVRSPILNRADTQDLIVAIEMADEEQFLDKLQAYDSLSKLDRWKTAIFLKVKEGIDTEPDLT